MWKMASLFGFCGPRIVNMDKPRDESCSGLGEVPIPSDQCRCATRVYPHFDPACQVHRVLCKHHPNPVIREMAQAAEAQGDRVS